MSAEGKPIQVPANSLQMQGVQSLSGMSHLIRNEKKMFIFQELSISMRIGDIFSLSLRNFAISRCLVENYINILLRALMQNKTFKYRWVTNKLVLNLCWLISKFFCLHMKEDL